MTREQTTAEVQMEETAEDLRLLVRDADEWDTETWEVLSEILDEEQAGIAEADLTATVRFSQAAKLLVEYLGEHPTPEFLAILYWNLSIGLRAAYATIVQMHDYVAGIDHLSSSPEQYDLAIRFEDSVFMRSEEILLLSSLNLCGELRQRIADCSYLALQEAEIGVDTHLEIGIIRDLVRDDDMWNEDTLKILYRALKGERESMREANPFAVKIYAEILKLFVGYFSAFPRYHAQKIIARIGRSDLAELQKYMKNRFAFSAYEKDTLYVAKSHCHAHLIYLEAINKSPGAR